MKILLLGVSLLLTSCLDNSPADQAPPPVIPILDGYVNARDVSGTEKFADIYANFDLVTESAEGSVRSLKAELGTGRAADGKVSCKTVTGQVESQQKGVLQANLLTAAAATANRVSVGELQFGLANGTDRVTFKEKENHDYLVELDAGITPKSYVVSAAGTESVKRFDVLMKMPEFLNSVRANDSDFEGGTVTIEKGQPLVAEWNAPPQFSDDAFAVVEVRAQKGNTVTIVRCIAEESDLIQGSIAHWEIDANNFEKLPSQTVGLILISRVLAAQNKKPSIYLESWRTQYTLTEIY